MAEKTYTPLPPWQRTDYCGALRSFDAGREVALFGWVNSRRDHGGLIFVDLRDREGIVQTVFNPESHQEAHEVAKRMRSEFVVALSGIVRPRPAGAENATLPTGAIEVAVQQAWVLSEAKPPVFPIEEQTDVAEEIRLT